MDHIGYLSLGHDNNITTLVNYTKDSKVWLCQLTPDVFYYDQIII